MAPEGQAAPGAEPSAPRRRLWLFAALSLVAGVLTVNALRDDAKNVRADVRSGSPGFKQSSTGKNIHWQKSAVTIFLDDSLSKLGPGASEAVMQAFGRWVASDPNLPSISFDTGKTSTEPKQDGKSTVSFGRITHPGHERDLAITITYSDDETGEILEADVIFNAMHALGVLKERAHGHHGEGPRHSGDGPAAGTPAAGAAEADECGSRYDTQNVATHEAGHFFGLGEDVIERQATMFLSISRCETHKRELSPTDVSAVSTLYASTVSEEEQAAGPRACSFVGLPATSSALAWAPAVALALALGRRRRAR